VSGTHIADTGFFVALGQPENPRYQRVRTFARRNEIVFLVPERVYDELTEPISGTATIETAIDEGWAAVGDSLTYSVSLVSNTMDGVQRYIATADDRPEDEIERADAALGGLAAQVLAADPSACVYIYTPDIAAGEGVETVLASHGYGESVTFVNAFEFIEALLE
jgi:predicted nucleic acid-binding protein